MLHIQLDIPKTKHKMTLNKAYSSNPLIKTSWHRQWKKEIERNSGQVQKLDHKKRYDYIAVYHFDKRIPDSGNCEPMSKIILDILVQDYDILPDDKPKHVRFAANESRHEGRKDNTVDLFFLEVDDDCDSVNHGFNIGVNEIPVVESDPVDIFE